jgi:hypothetical protein
MSDTLPETITPAMAELTDDLTPNQFQQLLMYLWVNRYSVSIPTIKSWRRKNELFTSHYDYLEKYLPSFFKNLEIDWERYQGIIAAHGDKCGSYRDRWAKHEIPFWQGVAIYLLSYIHPYSHEVRETERDGWVDPCDWVINNHSRFKEFFPAID